MSKHIYLDYETEGMIKKLREKQPDFNLSNFVRLALVEMTGSKTALDLATINKNKEDAKMMIEKGTKDFDFWEQKLNDFLIQEEVNKREEAQKKLLDEKKATLREQAKINIMKIFKEEMDREMSEFEYEEYLKLEKSNIWGFCDRLKEGKGVNKDS